MEGQGRVAMASMSELPHSGARFCPDVGPRRTPGETVAEGFLGLELAPGGLWARPLKAAAYWHWLRDSQPPHPVDLEDLFAWLRRFVGLPEGVVDGPRVFAMGFTQGAECALREVPIPEEVLDPVPDDLQAHAASMAASIGSVSGPDPLHRLRGWATLWLPTDTATPRSTCWRLGMAMGHAATATHPLVCGMLSTDLEGARAEQRFASRILLQRPVELPQPLWPSFIRSTYGPGMEGHAILASVTEGLRQAHAGQWTLREFLLDGLTRGRVFARGQPQDAARMAEELGPGSIDRLCTFFSQNSGAIHTQASSGTLLNAMRHWILQTHGGLFAPNDPSAEHLALRHAYDFLWWRGFLEESANPGPEPVPR